MVQLFRTIFSLMAIFKDLLFYKYDIRNYGVIPSTLLMNQYEISLKDKDEKIIITQGMVNFFEDFVEKKLAKVTKSELAELETYRDELSKEEVRRALKRVV